MSNGASELVLGDRETASLSPPVDQSEGRPAPSAEVPNGGARTFSPVVEMFSATEHYDTVCEWWRSQNWPTIPLDHLPRTGIVVSHKGKPAAAVWIFQSDSAFCWIAFPIAGKHIRKALRSEILSVLIESAKRVAQSMGYQSAVMSLRNQCLERRIEKHGFIPTDRGVTHYYGDLRR